MEGAPGLGIFPAKTQLWDELFHYICQLIAQECFFLIFTNCYNFRPLLHCLDKL